MQWFQTRDFLQEVPAKPSFCNRINNKKFKVDDVRILVFENVRPTARPSPMKLALGISASSRSWFVYYT